MRPKILVTNDDGITSRGIAKLVEIAKGFGDVVVVAPNSPQSGMGHALTIEEPLSLYETDIFTQVTAFECSGTPVDCVKLAKNVLFKNDTIDLCLSGINHGSNASINILYSGTVSAAMEASLEGINSIGFSLCDYSHQADFSQAQDHIAQIIDAALNNGLGTAKLLNVNIPKAQKNEINGIKICRQARGNWIERFQEGTNPRGQKYYWLTGEFISEEKDKDTDLWALEHRYISVVPSMWDLTDHESLTTLSHLAS